MYTKTFTIVASALALVLQSNPLQNSPAGGGGSTLQAPFINIVEFSEAVQIAKNANLPMNAWMPFYGNIKVQNQTPSGNVISLVPAGRAAVLYHSTGCPGAIAINGGLAGMWIISSVASNVEFMPVQPEPEFTVISDNGTHSAVKGPAIGFVTTAVVSWFDPIKYSLSAPEKLIYIMLASSYCGGVVVTPGLIHQAGQPYGHDYGYAH
ncbi:MAG: hypothetical protein ACKVS6_04585 [Planctomycetota bacterium]